MSAAIAYCIAPCDLEIPPDVTLTEPEPCGSATNEGCNSQPPMFTQVVCGEVVHGTAWLDAGKLRDTDWYQLTLTEETVVTLTVVSEFESLYGFAATDTPGSGDCGDLLGVVDPAVFGPRCYETTTGPVTWPPGQHWVFVATSFGPEDILCGTIGSDYILRIECAPVCSYDCGDPADGVVDIGDLLALLSQWGQGGPCDVDGGGVDIGDLLGLLAAWGDCV